MAHAENQLIARLPPKARGRLLQLCEPFELKTAEVLSEGGNPIRYVYFPVKGFVSMVTLLDGKPALEVGMVGQEGMVGAQMVIGVTREALHAVVQGPGTAYRIPSAAFRVELDVSPALREALNNYLHVTITLLATSSACLRFHQIGPRLARWLLMTQDRARSDDFFLTHEFLALMLGVRRVGITQAAAALQRKGLITYRRGHITVLDRRGLLQAACGCYAAETRSFAELMGFDPTIPSP
jgi:CRP-like cAMP-binding protein